VLTGCFQGAEETLDFMWRQFNVGSTKEVLRDRVVRMDLATQLPNEFLQMTDRFSMAHSIEARTPFLDHEFTEQTYAISADRRLNPIHYKRLLKSIVAPWVPQELLGAPKRGFVIPLALWLRGPLQPLLRRLLQPERLADQNIVQSDYFIHYGLPHLEGKKDNTAQLWCMLMFQLWWSVFIEKTDQSQLQEEIEAGT